MSLVNAVHVLLEVAAGRRNLSAAEADELHAAVDAEQAPAEPENPTVTAPVPTAQDAPATEAVNLDAPADA